MLEIKFRRFLQTGDSDDYVMTVGQTLNLVWAYGYPDRIYHGTSNRGNQTVLLDQTTASSAVLLSMMSRLCMIAAAALFLIM